MYKVLICQHNTLNFIDGVGNEDLFPYEKSFSRRHCQGEI